MIGKRLKDYQRQYDIHYGVRKKKEDIERKYLEEKEKRQPHIHFFGRVGDVFEARMPNWNTWYAGRLTHKDEVLGTVSMQFDDARLIGTSTAVLEANEDRDHNPLKLVVCVDRPKWNRIVEDIPKEFVRPITTGRLRLYKELTSSLRLIKKKVKQKNEDELVIRNALNPQSHQAADNKTGKTAGQTGRTGPARAAGSKRQLAVQTKQRPLKIGPKRLKELKLKEQEILLIGLRPSDMALALQKESDDVIERALKGLPPSQLDYDFVMDKAAAKKKESGNQDKSFGSTSSIGIGLDMPTLNDIVAVKLKGWKMEYLGRVTNSCDLEAERKEARLKERNSKILSSNSCNNSCNNSNKNLKSDNNLGDETLSLLWTVDVFFDDFEMSIEQKWNPGVTARVVIDLNAEHLVPVTPARLKQYLFMKNVWLTRQKQQEKKEDTDEEKERKKVLAEKQAQRDATLSWSEKRDRERRLAMRKFKSEIQKGATWFELPVELDEFGFPIPEDDFSSSDEEKEDEEESEPPPFVICKGPKI